MSGTVCFGSSLGGNEEDSKRRESERRQRTVLMAVLEECHIFAILKLEPPREHLRMTSNFPQNLTVRPS